LATSGDVLFVARGSDGGFVKIERGVNLRATHQAGGNREVPTVHNE